MNEEQQHQMINDRKPETFGDMSTYLLSKRNCRVNGKGFIVRNLHDYVNNAIEMVESIPEDQRKNNLMTKTTKWGMERVFNAFLDGDIEPPNTIHPKKFGSIWNN